MFRRLLHRGIALAAVLGIAFPAYAGFMGKTLDAAWYFPTAQTPYQFGVATPPTFAVGAGVETSIDVESVVQVSADFSDLSLRLTFATILSNPTWTDAAFNGPVFNVIGGGPLDLLDVQLSPASTMADFDASRVSFDATGLAVNFAGLSYVDGTVVELLFTSASAPIPLPGTVTLVGLGLGLAGIAVAGRRRAAPA